jgi:superfamily I DNA/RNA helicase
MSKFLPSAQQTTFFNWIKDGEGSCVLEAVAGSGKTTTLIEALKIMKGTIFFGAYNKKIAVEISDRAPKLKNGLNISTMHAAGFKAWRKAAPRVQVNNDKCRDIYRMVTQGIFGYGLFEGPVLQLVSYAKQAALGYNSNESDRGEWIKFIDHFGVECFDEKSGIDNTDVIINLAKDVFKRSIANNNRVIDFDDMIFAPLYHNVSIDEYDWVLLDEAQDTNASRRYLAVLMMKQNGRLVAVGDKHQAIYGFTGADANSLELIGNAVNAIKLPLSFTFRCPQNVVAHAKQWVNHIECSPTAAPGVVSQLVDTELMKVAKVGDAIVSRFNAPLIKYVYQFIGAGIPARIEGREIASGLKKLAGRWKCKTFDALITKLEEFEEREIKKLLAQEKNRQADDLMDKLQCLKVIITRAMAKNTKLSPQQAIELEIDEIFGQEESKKPVVLLCSIHRSKGLEWKRVFWLQTGPSGFAKKQWELEQEDNLCYVATTRAMEELILVTLTKD